MSWPMLHCSCVLSLGDGDGFVAVSGAWFCCTVGTGTDVAGALVIST